MGNKIKTSLIIISYALSIPLVTVLSIVFYRHMNFDSGEGFIFFMSIIVSMFVAAFGLFEIITLLDKDE